MALFIGLDFGTHSVRGILFDPNRQTTIKSSSESYETIDFEDGSCLFRDADDWVRAGEKVLNDLASNETFAGAVRGIGVTFTSCTIVPIREDGTPVASHADDPLKRPHVFPKMWRHHSPYTQKIATELTAAVKSRGETWLDEYFGGNIGLEWLHPKALEVYDFDRAAFETTHAFVEAGDYVVWALAGRKLPLKAHLKRSTQQAAFKACYVSGKQYVSDDIIRAIRPKITLAELRRINSESNFDFVAPGTRVGHLESSALRGVDIATASIDAHACAFGLGAFQKGRFVMVVGTSACFMMTCDTPLRPIRGVAGSIANGIVKGLHSFEFGQAAAGDACAWLSRFTGQSLSMLESGALQLLKPSSSQRELECWAVDHLNGCRTPLMDGHAKGSLRNLTLSTTPAHAFLALIESLCFGIRVVVELVRKGQVHIKDFVLAGGLSKSELFQVTLATVLNQPIVVYQDGGEATSRGAAAYASLMTSASSQMVARFQPNTFSIVRPNQAYLKVFCGEARFQRYLDAANVRGFL